MSLLKMFTRVSIAEATEQLGRATAEACRDELWRRAIRRAGTMSPAEARGYLRVRGARLVAMAADHRLAAHPQRHRIDAARVAALAGERLTRELVDLMIEQPSASVRRAA